MAAYWEDSREMHGSGRRRIPQRDLLGGGLGIISCQEEDKPRTGRGGVGAHGATRGYGCGGSINDVGCFSGTGVGFGHGGNRHADANDTDFVAGCNDSGSRHVPPSAASLDVGSGSAPRVHTGSNSAHHANHPRSPTQSFTSGSEVLGSVHARALFGDVRLRDDGNAAFQRPHAREVDREQRVEESSDPTYSRGGRSDGPPRDGEIGSRGGRWEEPESGPSPRGFWGEEMPLVVPGRSRIDDQSASQVAISVVCRE
eukprot:TRINITY_DN14834_c0_g1_i1.p1 TRINITY_DN14834_c0_g1~~TRINITY_DN14834_c0_g1_i1.p1  ORF type:complete len:264 (-),score=29.39 TRINITY_DN14834_c0_g1_i1:27-794(-)